MAQCLHDAVLPTADPPKGMVPWYCFRCLHILTLEENEGRVWRYSNVHGVFFEAEKKELDHLDDVFFYDRDGNKVFVVLDRE